MSKSRTPATPSSPAPTLPLDLPASAGPPVRVSLAPSLAGLMIPADAIVRDLLAQVVEQAAENGRLRAMLAPAEARRRPASEPAFGQETAQALADLSARLVRLLEQAVEHGLVPDDLPASPLRDALQAAAALRAALAAEQSIAAQARAETIAAQAAAKRHHDELQALRASAPAAAQAPAPEVEELAKLRADLKAAQKSLAGAQRVADLARQEAAHLRDLAPKAEAAERAAAEARAALALVAEAAGCETDTAPADIAHRIAERLSAAPALPARPQVEPPPMREAAWTELQSGELAVDRRALRRLQEMYDAAGAGTGPEPSDPERRVLALRVGNQVSWLRGDGLWADGTPFEEGQPFKPARFREWISPRALVIAEGLTGDPGEVARAFRTWHEAARLCPGLEVALADEPAPAAD